MSNFYKNHGPYDINYILKKTLFVKIRKFKNQKIINISSISDAKKGCITFLNNEKYIQDLNKSFASFCLIQKKFIDKVKNKKIKLIESTNPLIDFILITKLFYPSADNDNLTFSTNNVFLNYKKNNNSFIDKSVKIGKDFKVGFNTVIKKNVMIGNNVSIGSNCVISNSIIEDNVMINDGSVIGKIGFGFKKISDKIVFIPHIGCVKINKNAYIGSNCTIDRGSFANTVIGENSMLDNQVHIAHNVSIGSNCIIAGKVGIAGSSKIGRGCMIGGNTGISGHLVIGDYVQIGGQSGVLKNITSNSKVMGYPATSLRNFLKNKL